MMQGKAATRFSRRARINSLPGQPFTREQFALWAKQCSGLNTVHHYHALRICWPYLKRRPQKALAIADDPLPWLRTIEHFSPVRHELRGCAHGQAVEQGGDFPVTRVELDPWSPLATAGLPGALQGDDYALITALGLVDHLYHPLPFLEAAAAALIPGGLLVLTAENVASRANLLRLLDGNGLAANLDALVESAGGPRPQVRQYCWREMAIAAFHRGFLPVAHGFYEARSSKDLPPAATRILESAARPLMPERQQLKSDWYLVLRKTRGIPVRRFTAYMLRHGPRATIRHARAQFMARLRSIA